MAPRLKTFAALLFLGLAAAFSVSGSPPRARTRFPIGIYEVGDAGQLDRLAEGGFDSAVVAASGADGAAAIASAARRRGMRMYLQAEPGSSRTSAPDLERPQVCAFSRVSAAKEHGCVGDIFMLQWHQAPQQKLDSLADEIDIASRALPQGKPLWLAAQALDRAGRFPSRAEIRFMSYLAVVHGAKGLFYSLLDQPGGETLLDQPELWQALAGVAGEIKALRPVLEEGLCAAPAAPMLGGAEAKVWRYRGRDYAVILNRSEKEARDVPAPFLAPDWKALFEPRRNPKDNLDQTGSTPRLNPHQVLVLESSLRWGTRL